MGFCSGRHQPAARGWQGAGEGAADPLKPSLQGIWASGLVHALWRRGKVGPACTPPTKSCIGCAGVGGRVRGLVRHKKPGCVGEGHVRREGVPMLRFLSSLQFPRRPWSQPHGISKGGTRCPEGPFNPQGPNSHGWRGVWERDIPAACSPSCPGTQPIAGLPAG